MIDQKIIVEEPVQEDDGLTFRIEPPVVLVTPAEAAPVPLVVLKESAEEEAVGEWTPVVSPGPKDGPPSREPMKILKIRVGCRYRFAPVLPAEFC